MNLKLHEVINLYYELNGVTKVENQKEEVISKGLLKQKISLKTKVYLQRLNKIVSEEYKLYEEAKQELFKKFGKEENDNLVIPSESFPDFAKEHKDLLEAEKEIKPSTIWGADFTLASLEEVETDEFYPQLFDLIDNG